MSEAVVKIYGWRAEASRETVVMMCDRRAERAETVMNI